MREARVQTRLWVQATLRRLDGQGLPCALLRRGDPDAGAVLVRLDRRAEGVVVLALARQPDGRLGWTRATGPDPVAPDAADAYVARQTARDPDLWVIEIDDPKGLATLDTPAG
jgi:hypothetical protein